MGPSQSIFLGTIFVMLAALCFGSVPFFARSLIEGGMRPVDVAFWRFALPGLIFFPFVWRARVHVVPIAWAVSAGLALGLGWIGYATALQTLPVATVGVLYMTYPLFTALLGWVWFGYRPSLQAWTAAALVLVAAAVSASTGPVSADDIPAMLIALTAPLGFSYGIAVLTMKLGDLGIIARMASIQLGTLLGLAPLLLATGGLATLLPATTTGWWLVFGVALVAAFVPQLVYTIWAPRIGATRTAIAGSVELPTMFVVGWVAFAEPLGLGQWIAGGLILAAIILSQARQTE
ncbi:MAG: DMT family transporter [Pseudomonadota bacterium]